MGVRFTLAIDAGLRTKDHQRASEVDVVQGSEANGNRSFCAEGCGVAAGDDDRPDGRPSASRQRRELVGGERCIFALATDRNRDLPVYP